MRVRGLHGLVGAVQEDAAELLALYKDDASLEWRYNAALVAYIREGDSTPAKNAIQAAISFNPYVAEYLLGLSDVPGNSSAEDPKSDEYAAVSYMHLYGEIWEKAPSAIDWLRSLYGGAVH